MNERINEQLVEGVCVALRVLSLGGTLFQLINVMIKEDPIFIFMGFMF